MTKYNKAIFAVGGAVAAVAAAVGFNIDPTALAAVEGALISLLVLIVPNTPA